MLAAMVRDEVLFEAWRGGDARAGAELFERHYPAIARFFRNKVDVDAPDLIQKTFLGCIEGRERVRGDSSFRTYLFAVAHNVLYKHFRTRARSGARIDFGVTSVHDLRPTATALLARRGEERALLAALRRIPLEHQVVLELYFWEHLTAGEMAEIQGVPEGTVRTRLRRAKQLLEAALGQVATSPAEMQDTLSDLDSWARSVRAQLDSRP
jgi:RNA polymerase sigma factor (sigma-70 family)